MAHGLGLWNRQLLHTRRRQTQLMGSRSQVRLRENEVVFCWLMSAAVEVGLGMVVDPVSGNCVLTSVLFTTRQYLDVMNGIHGNWKPWTWKCAHFFKNVLVFGSRLDVCWHHLGQYCRILRSKVPMLRPVRSLPQYPPHEIVSVIWCKISNVLRAVLLPCKSDCAVGEVLYKLMLVGARA